MRLFRTIAAVVLGLFFLYSGAVKASYSDEFAMNIAQYLILPPSTWKAAAIVISIMEFFAGVLLLIPATRRWGALLVLILMAIFLCALGTAIARGLVIECGCLPGLKGKGPQALRMAFWRDLGIALVALSIFMFAPKKHIESKGIT